MLSTALQQLQTARTITNHCETYSILNMPIGRSEPIHFGFRFGAQDSIGFSKPSRKKRSSQPEPASTAKETAGDGSRTVTLCDGYAPSTGGRTTTYDERAPLLQDTRTPSEIAPGTMIICDGKPYAHATSSTKRSTSSLLHNHRELPVAASARKSTATSSRKDAFKSRIQGWATDVLAESGKTYDADSRSVASFGNKSVTPSDSVSRSSRAGETTSGNPSYRKPYATTLLSEGSRSSRR